MRKNNIPSVNVSQRKVMNAVWACMLATYEQEEAKKLRNRYPSPIKMPPLPSPERLLIALRHIVALTDIDPSLVNYDIKTVIQRAYREASRMERVCHKTR